MFRFFVKTFILMSVLFIGIIIGFQEANHGLHKMKGYDDAGFPHVLLWHKENGEIETTILGETITSHDLEEKEKILEELSTYNIFTDMAKKMTNIINQSLSKIFPDS